MRLRCCQEGGGGACWAVLLLAWFEGPAVEVERGREPNENVPSFDCPSLILPNFTRKKSSVKKNSGSAKNTGSAEIKIGNCIPRAPAKVNECPSLK